MNVTPTRKPKNYGSLSASQKAKIDEKIRTTNTGYKYDRSNKEAGPLICGYSAMIQITLKPAEINPPEKKLQNTQNTHDSSLDMATKNAINTMATEAMPKAPENATTQHTTLSADKTSFDTAIKENVNYCMGAR